VSEDIGQRAVRGAVWLGGGQLLRQVIGFGTTAALARLLTPDDFGVFGMTFMVAELAQTLAAFGFGAAIVQRQVDSPDVLSTCFWANIALGMVIGVLLILSGPAVALYFKRPEIAQLLWPLALMLLVTAGMVVPQSLLTQRMNFADIVKAQVVGSVVAAVVTIGAGLAGAGYWSLALQPLVGNLVTGVMMMVASRWLPRWHARRSDIADMMSFSTHLLGGNIVGFVGRNMPGIVIGRVLDAASLAMYGLASHITGSVLFQISSVIVRVLFPTLSALKDEPARMQAIWFRSCSAIAIIAFPAMAGTAAVADDLVHLLLGPNWAGAADPLRVLGLAMAVQAVLTTSGTVLMALGRADTLFHISIGTTAALAAGLMLGTRYGVVGAAVGYALASTSTMLVQTWLACRESKSGFGALALELAPWALASAMAAMAMAGLTALLPQWAPTLRLAACTVSGAAVYLGVLMLVSRARTLELVMDVWSRLRK
jgi:O-antigen/teichoic acid export membrane protein